MPSLGTDIRTYRRLAIALIPVALLATGCGGSDDDPTVDRATSSNDVTTPPAQEPTSSAEPEEPAKLGEIVKTGFGQKDEYVYATSLVKNLTDQAGATVKVQYNVKDAAGKILVSDTQVESFSRGGELVAVGMQLTSPGGAKAASVEANLVVEPDGIGEEFPESKVGPVTVTTDEFGQPAANFEVTNPTAEPVSSLRIGVICYDAAGKIIGGTSEFPDLPPNGTVRVDTLTLIISGKPAKCEAYAGGTL